MKTFLTQKRIRQEEATENQFLLPLKNAKSVEFLPQIVPVIIQPIRPPNDISQMAGDKLARPFLREYPKQDKGHSAGRSFLSSWYKIYDWSEHSLERDAWKITNIANFPT